MSQGFQGDPITKSPQETALLKQAFNKAVRIEFGGQQNAQHWSYGHFM